MGAEIVGVSFDPPHENRAFAEKYGFRFRLLSDVEREVGERYETRRAPDEKYAGTPRRITYLIDPEGRIARAYRVKDIPAHPAQVLEDLRTLRGHEGEAK